MQKKPQILVADADPRALTKLKEVCSPLGVDLLWAKNGHEGLRLALSKFPQLMLVNTRLPDLDGIALVRLLQALELKITAIYVAEPSEFLKHKGQLPPVLGTCWTNRIHEDLPALVKTALEEPRVYTDVQLKMVYAEFVALLAKPERKKILLASTAAVLRSLHGQLDAKNHYALFQAQDGREALIKAVALQPDLILASSELAMLPAEEFVLLTEMLAPKSKLVMLTPSQDPRLQELAKNYPQISEIWNSGQCMADRKFFTDSVQRVLGVGERELEQASGLFKLVDSMSLSGHTGHDDLMDDPTLFQDFDDVDLD